jgi:phytoene synthase
VTPELKRSYALCRTLTRRHGTTYYWAANLLTRRQRRHVWALYAFARHADDLVDDRGATTVAEREQALSALDRRLRAGLEAGTSDDPLLAAVVDTVLCLEIDADCFARFLHSMRMDLTIDHYDSWGDLLVYMDGSAAVIGEMMLPVLRPTSPAALGPARDLGLAFQLTNFLRDVDEDLDLGRVYLPQEDLDRFGADPAARRVDPSWVALMRFEIERCRELYRSADEGIKMLPGASGRCVRAARLLYGEILDRIEAAGFDVFAGRVRVPTSRKLAVAARQLATR